jgi:hypothetical protein
MFYDEQLEYRVARYKEILREAERRRPGIDRGWHLYQVWEAVRQAAERLWQSYNREGERCLELQPACEMRFG